MVTTHSIGWVDDIDDPIYGNGRRGVVTGEQGVLQLPGPSPKVVDDTSQNKQAHRDEEEDDDKETGRIRRAVIGQCSKPSVQVVEHRVQNASHVSARQKF